MVSDDRTEGVLPGRPSLGFKFKLFVAFTSIAKLILIFAFISALPACATKPATFAQKDPRVDLYAFKTFAFFGPSSGQRGRAGYTTLVGEQLKNATRAQLERRGYVFTLAVQQRAEVRSALGTRAMPYQAWRTSSIETVEYPQRRTMVWRRVAQDRISPKDMQNVDATIRDAVRELFAKYPRKA
jgi:hypothetical protein